MSVTEVTTKWEAFDQTFPSLSEYDQSSGAAEIQTDTVEDGEYTLALVHMSQPIENKYPDPRQKNPKPVVFLYFRVLEADDPGDVGKVLRKKVTYSGHPKASSYPFLQASYGGRIPPDVSPTFGNMRDMQIKAFLQTKNDVGNDGRPFSYQDWQAIRPVKDKLPVVPF